MDNSIWPKLHGATTHFPIALIMASVLFDILGLIVPENPAKSRRTGFHSAGFCSIVLGALGSLGAVLSGLVISHWQLLGVGNLARHHFFLWPAFGLLIVLAAWRFIVHDRASPLAFKLYVATACLTAVLMAIAGYFGGELLLNG